MCWFMNKNNNNDYEGSDVTHRSPLIGSPGGAGSGPTGLLCSGRDEMSAALLLDLGLVLIHADDLPLFDSLPAGHRALQTRDRQTDQTSASITLTSAVTTQMIHVIMPTLHSLWSQSDFRSYFTTPLNISKTRPNLVRLKIIIIIYF